MKHLTICITGNQLNYWYLLLLLIFPIFIVIREYIKGKQLNVYFGFREEMKGILKRDKKNRKALLLQSKNTEPQTQTLIGYSGRKMIYSNDLMRHLLLSGTTGSGKTVALANYIKTILQKGYGGLIIDGKGDMGEGSILDVIQKLNTGRKIYVINMNAPEQSDKYNPFVNASSTIAKDMLINMTDWSEEHYKSNAERYLQRLISMMIQAGIKLSFRKIITYMSLDNYNKLNNRLLENDLIDKIQYSENRVIGDTAGKIAQNSIARFSTIAESELGMIFDDNGIDISTALQENSIILFILNPLIYPELSPAFGRLITIDSKKAVSNLFKSPIGRTFFIFDELNVYVSPTLLDLINKSRSANVTCILAVQSLSDLEYEGSQSLKEQIIENCNNYLVLRQNSNTNADTWAKILGTRATMEVTYQMQQKGFNTSETGFGSARRIREYLYHPDDIKALRMGEGLFLSRDSNFHCKLKVNKPF